MLRRWRNASSWRKFSAIIFALLALVIVISVLVSTGGWGLVLIAVFGLVLVVGLPVLTALAIVSIKPSS